MCAADVFNDRPAGDVVLRDMTASDLACAHALSQGARWPHRLEDWQQVWPLGEGVVAERDGAVIGTAMRWRWGEHHATVGLVIVSPQHQGRRVGRCLMAAVLEPLGDRDVTLFATPEGRGLYARLGFTAIGEARQHQGVAVPTPMMAMEHGECLRAATRRDLTALVALDTVARGMPRDRLIAALIEAADTVVLDSPDGVQGFATVRRFGRGMMIGPVVAPDVAVAQVLIAYWLNRHVNRFVRIDVDSGSGLSAWLECCGLAGVDAPVVMVRGRPAQSVGSVQALALVSQALG
ncbi:GNAT family N-acetyltransferase [Alcaligenaceae bacterium C4P045]|nr:GNAT family N-acetyltransferase [Alcaligenaceae bacterium C4P045]